MQKDKIDLCMYCSLCHEKIEIKIEIPEHWKIPRSAIDIEDALCPKHASARDFFAQQCSGCAGGWPTCKLAKSFMGVPYSQATLTEADFVSLKSGVCPRRTNGTIAVKNHTIADIVLAQESVVGGQILAQAIMDWLARYNKEQKK